MVFQIILNVTARKEIQESFHWYELRQSGLGLRFINAIEKRFDFLSKTPDIFPVKSSGFREALVVDFPFSIIYKINSKQNTVKVFHVFHTRRNPNLKK